MIRFCFFFFSGSGVLGVWYEAGADCFCFAGEGVMAFPAVLFDGEAAFGVGVKVPVGGCRTDVEECGRNEMRFKLCVYALVLVFVLFLIISATSSLRA